MRISQIISKVQNGRMDLPYPICEFTQIVPQHIPFSESVRKACEQNACGCYGKYWSCPPGAGSLEENKQRLLKYKNAFVYTTKHQLEDSFDTDGMENGRKQHSKIDSALTKLLSDSGELFEILGTEGCSRCENCTYPDSPCRFPKTMHLSMEATGMNVVELASQTGLHYYNGVNTVTYFSMILF